MVHTRAWSVALATHNGSRFLEDQLNSLTQQRLLPLELVAVDDCSEDRTVQVLREYSRDAPFPVEIHQNECQLGPMAAFEKAIQHCRGRLIALCDQDDIWEPHKLQTLLELFEAQPQVALTFSNASLVDESGSPLGRDTFSLDQLAWTPEVREAFSAGNAFIHLIERNRIMGCCMAFRADFKDLVLPFPCQSALPAGLIHDAWIALLLSGVSKVAWTNEELVRYRVHPGQAVGVTLGSYSESTLPAPLDHTIEFHLQRSRPLLERFGGHRTRYSVLPSVMASLEDEVRHFETRQAVSLAGPQALTRFLREIRTGGYGRWSNGYRGILRDGARIAESYVRLRTVGRAVG